MHISCHFLFSLSVHHYSYVDIADFIYSEFNRSLVGDRDTEIDIYESLAMAVPGMVAHLSSLKRGAQLKVPAFD